VSKIVAYWYLPFGPGPSSAGRRNTSRDLGQEPVRRTNLDLGMVGWPTTWRAASPVPSRAPLDDFVDELAADYDHGGAGVGGARSTEANGDQPKGDVCWLRWTTPWAPRRLSATVTIVQGDAFQREPHRDTRSSCHSRATSAWRRRPGNVVPRRAGAPGYPKDSVSQRSRSSYD